MFEMKYDKNGMPITNPAQQEVPQEAVSEEKQDFVGENVEEAHATPEQDVPVVEQKVEAPKKTADYNFEALRKENSRLAREREELLREREQLLSKKTEPKQQDEDYSIHLGDDDIAEGKHVSKLIKKIESLENKLNSYHKQSAEQNAASRFEVQYPDYKEVFSPENIQALNSMEPEIAMALANETNGYNKAVSTYKIIKKLGIHQDAQGPYQDHDSARAQKNMGKPRSAASISPQQGDSPLSRANAFANGLTPQLKEQLLKEMSDAIKQR